MYIRDQDCWEACTHTCTRTHTLLARGEGSPLGTPAVRYVLATKPGASPDAFVFRPPALKLNPQATTASLRPPPDDPLTCYKDLRYTPRCISASCFHLYYGGIESERERMRERACFICQDRAVRPIRKCLPDPGNRRNDFSAPHAGSQFTILVQAFLARNVSLVSS